MIAWDTLTAPVQRFALLRRLALLSICIVSASLHLRAQTDPWRLVGPYGGQVASIAQIGTTVFAATMENGMFRSDDSGDHWTQVPYAFNSYQIQKLLAHGSTLFGFGAMAYRTTDIGTTWTRFFNLSDYSGWFPDDICLIGDTMYAAVNGGRIYRSLDNGTDWLQVGKAPGRWTSILASHRSTLYFSADSGLYRSNDGGSTWERVMVTATGLSVRAFAAHDSVLVLTIGDVPYLTSDRVYRSTDNGSTWEYAGEGITAGRIRTIVWDGSRFLAGGGYHGGVFTSTDGSVWTPMPGGFTDEINTISIAGDLMFAGSGDGRDGGIYRSTDRGSTWKLVNDGFSTISANAIVKFGDEMYAATKYDGVYKSIDNGAHWAHPSGSLPVTSITSIAASYNAVVIGLQYYGAGVGGGIYRTTDQGASWSRTDPGFDQVSALTASGNLMAALVPGPSGYGICRSTDGGASWTPAGIVSAEQATDLKFFHGVLFLATSTGLFRSLDTGVTWEGANNGLVNQDLTSIGTGDNVLFVGAYEFSHPAAIYRSTDIGNSWTLMQEPGTGTDRISGFTSYGSTIVASFPWSGLLRSTDNGLSWEPFNNGLINLGTATVAFADAALLTSAIGGGIYRTTTPLGVERIERPAGDAMSAVYPNPCRGSATIRYTVPGNRAAGAAVELAVFDALGSKVTTLVAERQRPGTYLANLDATGLAAGTYFYRLRIGTENAVRPLVVER